ncbi:hypothetical protein Dimus_029695 [Dionaea muscipula]
MGAQSVARLSQLALTAEANSTVLFGVSSFGCIVERVYGDYRERGRGLALWHGMKVNQVPGSNQVIAILDTKTCEI